MEEAASQLRDITDEPLRRETALHFALLGTLRYNLLELLELINDQEIAPLWAEDETIGWIYQYFNSKEERKQMRDESATPRKLRRWSGVSPSSSSAR